MAIQSGLLILICTQLLFTTSDLMGRYFMKKHGFAFESFFTWWFLLYFSIRMIATFGQLYIFTQNNLGKTMAMFGATSIVLSNVLAFLLLGEVLTLPTYLGIAFAIAAFITLSFKSI